MTSTVTFTAILLLSTGVLAQKPGSLIQTFFPWLNNPNGLQGGIQGGIQTLQQLPSAFTNGLTSGFNTFQSILNPQQQQQQQPQGIIFPILSSFMNPDQFSKIPSPASIGQQIIPQIPQQQSGIVGIPIQAPPFNRPSSVIPGFPTLPGSGLIAGNFNKRTGSTDNTEPGNTDVKETGNTAKPEVEAEEILAE